MENECKNYIHKYKCNSYAENPDNCKDCELRAVETVVFTIRHSKVEDCYFIRSDAKEISSTPVCATKLFSVMKEFKDFGEREGFNAVFEVD